YGTIRMHQERDYPGRISASDLVNPDFAALAHAYGCFGASVSATSEFAPALDAALAADTAALIELKIDAEVITTRATLSEIAAAARARQKRP
ncbi:MAG TPA: thiamine pyrophosphate-dependent enzyme, partial [Candidatus Cybelea sp.]|nr:thiamine pyrophosphate-dependent enzyme [Candidatus Cybelea sp.]